MKKNNINIWNYKINAEELSDQVENYYKYKLGKTYRGALIQTLFLLFIFTFVVSFFVPIFSPLESLIGIIIYLPFIYFVYKGSKWGLVFLSLLIILDRISVIYLAISSNYGVGGVVGQLFLGYFLLVLAYKAYLIESEKEKTTKIV